MVAKGKAVLATPPQNEGNDIGKYMSLADNPSTKGARAGASIWDDAAVHAEATDAYALMVDGNISQQSLADSFVMYFNYPGTFAYDWENGRWYRYSMRRWKAIRTIGNEIASWTAQRDANVWSQGYRQVAERRDLRGCRNPTQASPT